MLLVLAIDVMCAAILLSITTTKGLEYALPYFAFVVTLIPLECKIGLPGLFDLTTQRLLLVMLTVLYLILRKATSVETTPLKYLIFAHVSWTLVSTVNSVVFSVSVKQFLAQVLEYYLLYFILSKIISDVRTIRKILMGIVAAVAVCSVFGCFEAYFGWSVIALFPKQFWTTYDPGMGPLLVEFDRGLRVRSTFPHAILFGGAIAIAIPLALYLLTVAKSRAQKTFLWVANLMMFWNIYKTSSRGPWLALTLSIVLLSPFRRGKMRRYLVLIGVLTIAVLLIRPGVWKTLESDYISTYDAGTPMGASYAYRSVILQLVRQVLATQPSRAIWGYGLGAFRQVGLEGEFQGRRWYFLSCDSSWVLFMYETGYVGVFLTAMLLFKPILMGFKDFRELAKPGKYLSIVLVIVIFSFYFMMSNVAIYAWGQNGYMLWILIALSIVYGKLMRRERQVASAESQMRKTEQATMEVVVGKGGHAVGKGNGACLS